MLSNQQTVKVSRVKKTPCLRGGGGGGGVFLAGEVQSEKEPVCVCVCVCVRACVRACVRTCVRVYDGLRAPKVEKILNFSLLTPQICRGASNLLILSFNACKP